MSTLKRLFRAKKSYKPQVNSTPMLSYAIIYLTLSTELVANKSLLVLTKTFKNKQDFRNDYFVNICMFPYVTPLSFPTQCFPVRFLYHQWLQFMHCTRYCLVSDLSSQHAMDFMPHQKTICNELKSGDRAGHATGPLFLPKLLDNFLSNTS